MSSVRTQSHYFYVGLFVFATIALTVGGIVVLGGRTLYQDTITVETYFRSTVQGLDIGSPVKFRGVKIGTVKDIGVAFQYYGLQKRSEKRFHPADLVVVRMSLVEGSRFSVEESIEALVDQGLRVRLEQQGLTGVGYIEADFADRSEPREIEVPWKPDHPYIPSTVGGLASLEATAERILDGLERADVPTVAAHLDELILTVTQTVRDIGTVVQRVDGVIARVDGEVADVNLASLQREAEALMGQLRRSAANLEKQVESARVAELSSSAIQTLDAATMTLHTAEAGIAEMAQIVESGQYDVTATLDDLRATAENLRRLTDLHREHPSPRLRSDPPPQDASLAGDANR